MVLQLTGTTLTKCIRKGPALVRVVSVLSLFLPMFIRGM